MLARDPQAQAAQPLGRHEGRLVAHIVADHDGAAALERRPRGQRDQRRALRVAPRHGLQNLAAPRSTRS